MTCSSIKYFKKSCEWSKLEKGYCSVEEKKTSEGQKYNEKYLLRGISSNVGAYEKQGPYWSTNTETDVKITKIVGEWLSQIECGSECDNPAEPFPKDGKYRWVYENECIFGPSEWLISYKPGIGDILWITKKTRNYVCRLMKECRLDEVAPEMAKRSDFFKELIKGIRKPKSETQSGKEEREIVLAFKYFRKIRKWVLLSAKTKDGNNLLPGRRCNDFIKACPFWKTPTERDTIKNKYIKLWQDHRGLGEECDNPSEPFPNDGKFHFLPYHSAPGIHIKYMPGIKDILWMIKKARNYAFRLEKEGQLDTLSLLEKLSELAKKLPDIYEEVLAARKEKHEIQPTKEVRELFVFFRGVLEKSTSLNLSLIEKMAPKVQSLVDFKIFYTLANILCRQSGRVVVERLNRTIYTVLENVAKTCIGDAECIAVYKQILRSALRKKIINQHASDVLDSIAEDNKTFADERFQELKRQVQTLQEEMGILSKRMDRAEENILNVAQELSSLRTMMVKKALRDIGFGIVKTCFAFIGAQFMDFFSGIADFSDLSEIGSVVLSQGTFQITAEEVEDKLSSDKKFTIPVDVAKALVKEGLENPQELIDIFQETQKLISSEKEIEDTKILSSTITVKVKDSALEDVKEEVPVYSSSSSSSSSASAAPFSERSSFGHYTYEETTEEENFPLHEAISGGAPLEVITEMLTFTNPNTLDNKGERPIFLAARLGRVDIVTFLLSHGAKGAGVDWRLISQAKDIRNGQTQGSSSVGKL